MEVIRQINVEINYVIDMRLVYMFHHYLSINVYLKTLIFTLFMYACFSYLYVSMCVLNVSFNTTRAAFVWLLSGCRLTTLVTQIF